MCVCLYLHNKYKQYIHIYYVNNRLTALIKNIQNYKKNGYALTFSKYCIQVLLMVINIFCYWLFI